MASASGHLCDICVAQHLTNLAIKWCPECEDALCTDCIKPHGISKISRKHNTIDIEYHKKLPEFVSTFPQSCEEHDEKFQMFCTHHDVPCCGQCIAYKHNNCNGLLPISDIVNNAKTSSTLQNAEDILMMVRKNIEIIIKDRTQNIDNVESQINIIRNCVKETREKLLKHLDKLENDLLVEIENKACEVKHNIDTVLKDMTETDLKVQEYQDNIKAIKDYGTNMQTYFGTREVVKYAETEDIRISKLFKDGTLNKTNIQFNLDEAIKMWFSANIYGTLQVNSTESETKPFQTNKRGAQICKPVIRTKSVDEIKISLKNKFYVLKGKSGVKICGCDFTLDGRLVFADYYNTRIVLYTIEGTYINEVCISPHYTFDVSVLDEQSVVVSSAYNKLIQIINIPAKHIMKTISTDNECYGITHADGKVISAIDTKGIVCYTVNDNLSTTIRAEELGHCSYVTGYLDKLYYTNTADDSVTCLNTNGEVLWRFSDKSLLNDPRGISSDQYGNVYVSSLGNASVLVISADGKHGRKLLDRKDGLKKPCAISYDTLRSELVVANWSGDVFVFDIV